MEKHSKRNKSKDNPYTLSYNKITGSYIVEFKDNKNIIHNVEISDEVYQAFDRFELEDISQIHKYRKHIEHSEVFEESLYHRAIYQDKSVEETVEENILNDSLKSAIEKLTDTQKRRIKLYYFEDLNFKEIAQIEKCDESSVRESIYKGIEKIKKILN